MSAPNKTPPAIKLNERNYVEKPLLDQLLMVTDIRHPYCQDFNPPMRSRYKITSESNIYFITTSTRLWVPILFNETIFKPLGFG